MTQEPRHPMVEAMSGLWRLQMEEVKAFQKMVFDNVRKYMEEHPNWREELKNGEVDPGQSDSDL